MINILTENQITSYMRVGLLVVTNQQIMITKLCLLPPFGHCFGLMMRSFNILVLSNHFQQQQETTVLCTLINP